MKIWATIIAAGALIGSAFASTPAAQGDGENQWSINVGFSIPEGDLRDAGVDNMFSFGADWNLGYGMGDSGNTSTYIGLLAMFGSGDASLDVLTYGIHYGVEFGFGESGEWAVRLQGGYYNSKLDFGVADGVGSDDKWGFGGMGAVGYKPGGTFSIWAGYYFYPEVEGVDNRGFTVMVGIPVK